jgi:hypothetical protein
MIQLIKALVLSYQLNKQEKQLKKEQALQDKFWSTQISFEE